MATVVQSLGTLETLNMDLWPRSDPGALSLYDGYVYDYATMYRTQPNVRTVVDFLARNIAQLGLHTYRRVSDTDRERLSGHGMAQTIKRPNPYTTRYRLLNSLMVDLGIYYNAYWLKMRATSGRVALMRVPPAWVSILGGLVPTEYTVSVGTATLHVDPTAMVHFRGHNPDSTLRGLSPLETLRRILAEEWASGQWREGFWKHSAKQSLIIERPAGAPEWSEKSQEKWRAEFEALYSGGPGRTMVLEEGMTAKEISFDAQQSQYLEARKLTREEVAAAYHIPPPMVGILDNATFSNITEQHKSLYQDTLAPWCVMIEEDIDLQLLPEFGDTDGIYSEFNLEEKLKGSFEEQARSLQMLVGGPVMTQNEGRARLNLPTKGPDGDQLITPLNVTKGGQASPRDSAPPPGATNALVERFVNRQARVLRSNGGRYDAARWHRELVADLETIGG